MDLQSDPARGSRAAITRARSFGPGRFRVEMREPLGPVVTAFDVFDEYRAWWLFDQLVSSRQRVPHTLHWPITIVSLEWDGTTIWEDRA